MYSHTWLDLNVHTLDAIIMLHLGRWTFATTVPWQWSWSVARLPAALRSRRQRRKGLQHRRLRPPPRAWRVWSWRRTRRVWRNNRIWVGDFDKSKAGSWMVLTSRDFWLSAWTTPIYHKVVVWMVWDWGWHSLKTNIAPENRPIHVYKIS